MTKAAVSWLPTDLRKDVIELAERVNKVVGRFIRGQLIVSTMVGVLVACGLSLLGVRYALFLGLIAGLFDIISDLGPILAPCRRSCWRSFAYPLPPCGSFCSLSRSAAI